MLKNLYARLVLWLTSPALSIVAARAASQDKELREAGLDLNAAYRVQVQTSSNQYKADLSLFSER